MPDKKTKELTIRMYRQGLGDCFLISFPRNPEPFHLLIDCGALNSKHYDAELMKRVVRDIKEKTKGNIDAVVATHEHWDHISGFLQAEEVFREMDVSKVWASWTEEPNNEIAKILKEKFKKSKKAVRKAVEKIPDKKKDRHLGAYKEAITELFGFFGGLGANSEGNTAKAWNNYLGLSKNKIYCYPQNQPLEIEGVDDVRIYILGPPNDPDYIRKTLSKVETYDDGKHAFSAFNSFTAAFADENNSDDLDLQERSFPFDQRYRVLPETARENPFFKEYYGFNDTEGEAWRKIDYDWLSQAGELALHLDSYTNNTCLAMAIELGKEGKVILFPGDAQVGNWLSWNDLSWTIKDADGTGRKVKIDDLLAQTVFYKVGHHGSHNATLRAKGLEKMTSSELVAMIPVHRETAEDQSWEFPYPPLWKRLKEKCKGRVLLADAPNFDEIKDEALEMLDDKDWNDFEKATAFSDLYIEYKIVY